VIATQFVPPATAVVPCANAGTANTDAINSMNINIPNFRICDSPFYKLPPGGG
jgi:hypothetical protein